MAFIFSYFLKLFFHTHFRTFSYLSPFFRRPTPFSILDSHSAMDPFPHL